MGTNHERSLISTASSSSSSPPLRSSGDVDFADVFGGPPRRSLVHEIRSTSNGEGMDLPKTSSHRNPWTGLMEKPVFGDELSNRRRYTSTSHSHGQDFFDDIFGGSDLSSSPRKTDRDPPGSRVSSPKSELLGSSFPAQFSLPAKLIKAAELPTFSLGSRNKDGAANNYSFSLLSRSSSQKDQVREEFRNPAVESESAYCQSHESSNWPAPGTTEVESSKLNVDTSEMLTDRIHFHFSIYKWASKGAPIAMLLRKSGSFGLKEKSKIDKCSSFKMKASGIMEMELPTDTPSNYDLSNSGSSVMQLNKENGTKNFVHEIPSTIESSATIEEKWSPSVIETDLKNKPEEDTSSCTKNALKSELKTLGSLFSNQGPGNDETARRNAGRESKIRSTKRSTAFTPISKNVDQQNKEKEVLNTAETGKSTTLEGDEGKNKTKRNVKEVVKSFNQDVVETSKFDANFQDRSFRWNQREKLIKEHELPNTKPADKDMNRPSLSQNRSPEIFTKMEEFKFYRQTDEQDNGRENINYIRDGKSTGQIHSQASAADELRAVGGDEEESFEDNFEIHELPKDDNELAQPDNNHEEFQAISAKIRKWSNGKQGNIRSLLSTLQYVVWPESGWKPVPLVDIIEGNAVKRTYQKALLCLHPDKLQQKGASSEQKYTAAKVFDILQEAWDHYNSLGGCL